MTIPWIDRRYYDNSDHTWDFMPTVHQPGKEKFLHGDWPWPFKTIPRTWTSFKLLDAKMEGNQTHWIRNLGDGRQEVDKVSVHCPGEGWVPQPWPLRGQWQKTRIRFLCPITARIYRGWYEAHCSTAGRAWRKGPRISTDPSGFYVDWIPLPWLGNLLTVGTKKIW